MSKKKQNAAENEKKRSTADYYKLNKKAVDDLVTADVSNSPKVSEAELRKYRSGTRKFRFAEWFKAVFIKFWFPAAVCYFILMGLGMFIPTVLDQLFVTGIALGIITDLLTNNALRFIEETEGANKRWMMFPGKGYMTLPLNIIYAWVVLFVVYTIYFMLNTAIVSITHSTDTVPIGVEPILFGLFYVGADTLLIQAKFLCIRIFSDAKKQTTRG